MVEEVQLLTLSEVSKMLNISEMSVKRLRSSNQLPWVKMGRSVRFLRSDVEAYIKRHRRTA
jgi:excisionase family DNA binding protein